MGCRRDVEYAPRGSLSGGITVASGPPDASRGRSGREPPVCPGWQRPRAGRRVEASAATASASVRGCKARRQASCRRRVGAVIAASSLVRPSGPCYKDAICGQPSRHLASLLPDRQPHTERCRARSIRTRARPPSWSRDPDATTGGHVGQTRRSFLRAAALAAAAAGTPVRADREVTSRGAAAGALPADAQGQAGQPAAPPTPASNSRCRRCASARRRSAG